MSDLNPRKGVGVLLAVFAACAALGFAGCASDPQSKLGPVMLYGMVYDGEGAPIAGAMVTLDGAGKTTTDGQGRFFFESVQYGEHTLAVAKEGYRAFVGTIEYAPSSPVVYVKLISKDQLLIEAEMYMKKKEWAKAGELIAKALEVSPEDPVAIYMRSLLCYIANEPREMAVEAVSALEALVAKGFREPFVYLLLADIYQYRLDDPASAARNLRLYLPLREDAMTRERLSDLELSTNSE